MAALTLPPDYFRAAAERYKENPSDRYEWLSDQKSKAYQSLIQYQSELISLQAEVIKLGGEKGQAQGVGIVGGVLAAIPAGYTQVVGGILIVSAGFFAKAENKQKLKRIEDLKAIGQVRVSEAEQVGRYWTKYRNELLLWQLAPIILIIVILKS